MKTQEFENTITLNKKFNKSYCYTMFLLFLEKDNKQNQKIYDPICGKYIEINKTKEFLRFWRLYFQNLNKVLIEYDKSSTRTERLDLIHLIFGNTFKRIEVAWFLLPTTTIDVGFSFLVNKLNEHQNYIINNKKYDIKDE